MSFGMGMTFVPLDPDRGAPPASLETGIGSGVLNTMQQVGGALGLGGAGHARDPDLHRPGQGASGRRWPTRPSRARSSTEGATSAFLLGAILMLGASLDHLGVPQRQSTALLGDRTDPRRARRLSLHGPDGRVTVRPVHGYGRFI